MVINKQQVFEYLKKKHYLFTLINEILERQMKNSIMNNRI